MPLFDRDKGGENLEKLDLITRMIILGKLVQCLLYLTTKNKTHGDIQLSNILILNTASTVYVKLIDWANCLDSSTSSNLKDIEQLSSMLKQFFVGLEIPKEIESWMNNVEKHQYVTSESAINALKSSLQEWFEKQ